MRCPPSSPTHALRREASANVCRAYRRIPIGISTCAACTSPANAITVRCCNGTTARRLPPKAELAAALREVPLRGRHHRGWPPGRDTLLLPQAELAPALREVPLRGRHLRGWPPGRDRL